MRLKRPLLIAIAGAAYLCAVPAANFLVAAELGTETRTFTPYREAMDPYKATFLPPSRVAAEKGYGASFKSDGGQSMAFIEPMTVAECLAAIAREYRETRTNRGMWVDGERFRTDCDGYYSGRAVEFGFQHKEMESK